MNRFINHRTENTCKSYAEGMLMGAGVGVGMLMVLWFYVCMVFTSLWFDGFMVLWLYGFMVCMVL